VLWQGHVPPAVSLYLLKKASKGLQWRASCDDSSWERLGASSLLEHIIRNADFNSNFKPCAQVKEEEPEQVVKLPLSSHLKRQLIEDWTQVTENNKVSLVQLIA
jgi:hypothetical protein